MAAPTLEIRDLGPIAADDLQFGDLTVFTGPHASGKSIALQTLKLVLDRTAIVRRMADQGLPSTPHGSSVNATSPVSIKDTHMTSLTRSPPWVSMVSWQHVRLLNLSPEALI